MATTKDYLDFVCTQLEGIRGVDYKRMFGEYQIYVNDRPVLLVCDNTVFVKNHPALAHLLAEAPEGLPYPGAKPQKILDVEDRALTAQVLEILDAGRRRPAVRFSIIHNLYILPVRVIAISSRLW